MLVEIFDAPFNPMESLDVPTRLIAIQYHADDHEMETKMRAANALFDVSIRGMSSVMLQRLNFQTGYRVAIFEIKQ